MTPQEKALAAALKEAEKQARRIVPPTKSAADDGAAQFNLAPVAEYLNHLKREPREILEARYRHELRIEPPKEARHEWLVARLAYGFQLAHYRKAGYLKDGLHAPRSVVDRANDLAHANPGPLHECDKYDDKDPKSEDLELWDDARCVAVAEQPFERGPNVLAYHAIQATGAAGIDFATLAGVCEAAYECSVGDAQTKALAFFTTRVREGVTKVVIVSEDVP